MSNGSEPDDDPVVVFKIFTVPDVAGLRLLHQLPAALADNEVVESAYQKGRARADVSNAPDILPLHLHRVVSIACTWQDHQQFRVLSLAQSGKDEAALIQQFFSLLAQEKAQPISWHGARFDLPVLQYRGLMHGVSARVLAGTASADLAQLLAMQSGAQVSMHELAGLCGFPNTPCLSENQIWSAWSSSRADEIHAQCEMDAVLCHLLFLRFQLLRGALDSAQYAQKLHMMRETLSGLHARPWPEFLADWAS